ncbi:MAG: DUF2314 domain-containing protein [Rhodoferax sp.]
MSEWQRPTTAYAFALYFADKKGAGPEKSARELAANSQYGFKVVAKLEPSAKSGPYLKLESVIGDIANQYKPPTVESLKYFGRGVSLAQAEGLQRSPQVLVMVFATSTRDALPSLLKASNLVHRLATETNALIWDAETREMFSPDAWKKTRLDGWEAQLPDVSRHITIHAYNDDGKVRAISLGMTKFALPDLVINDLVWSLSNPLSQAINVAAQTLVEGARPTTLGQYSLNVRSIKHAALRGSFESSILPTGTGRGHLWLFQSARQQGDPENTLAELQFESATGKDSTSRQTAFVAQVFGAQEDQVTLRKKNDTALREASDRARKKLPALRGAFQAGLQPGERILLKAPFATADRSTEWMWVEVIKWPGERITGMLANTPRYVPALQAGQMVEIKESEVFDYLRRFSDGKQEGNETGDILSKTQ